MPLHDVLTLSLICTAFVFGVETASVKATDGTSTKVVDETSTPLAVVVSSTPRPENLSCSVHTNCEDCLKQEGCFFCQDGSKCNVYVVKHLIPTDECRIKAIYYGTCQVNLLVVVVLSGLAAGLVLIAIIVCCCCCFCRRGGRLKLSKDDLKWVRQREERKTRAEEKRKERAARTAEIRHKYGLFKDDTPYQRFDT